MRKTIDKNISKEHQSLKVAHARLKVKYEELKKSLEKSQFINIICEDCIQVKTLKNDNKTLKYDNEALRILNERQHKSFIKKSGNLRRQF